MSGRGFVRPLLLAASLVCLAVGGWGGIVASRNFSLPPQDGERMSAREGRAFTAEYRAKSPWLDLGCDMLPFGLVGFVVPPFAIQFRRPE